MKKMILGALFCSLAFADSLNDIQKKQDNSYRSV